MDTNQQIITDLKNKIGFDQTLDFLSSWKGVPVVIRAQILKILDQRIQFRVAPPDSICLARDQEVLILHDIFIMGIQGRIHSFDPQAGIVVLGNFTYQDRGFGDRELVRVEPDGFIGAELTTSGATFSCQVVDLSLTGFGLVAQTQDFPALSKGTPAALKVNLLEQEFDIPCTVLGVFVKAASTRIAVSFSQNAAEHALVTRYITRRRAEIRQEIQNAYQQALGDNA